MIEKDKKIMAKELTEVLSECFRTPAEFKQFITMYNSAIKEVRTKFEILNDDLSLDIERNPIEMIKTRMKSAESIISKLDRRGFEHTVEAIENNIYDIAGVRVICSFVEDIYHVAEMFVSQDDVKLIEIKDYIKNPKENGYRSYHMIVEVPVFFASCTKRMKVEVQFRTIAMDFWASLEHKMRYKKDIENTAEIQQELKECAAVIASTDFKMQEINKTISRLKNEK